MNTLYIIAPLIFVIISLLLWIYNLKSDINLLRYAEEVHLNKIAEQEQTINKQSSILETNKQFMDALAQKYQHDISDKDKTINNLKSKSGISYCH